MNKRGYTLIELMVAVGLFAIVMTIASGAYLVAIHVNRKAQATATGVNNLSFAIETMARTIRTGTDYSCAHGGGAGTCHVGGDDMFRVIDQDGKAMEYTLSGGVIMQNDVPITDPSVNITSLRFIAAGTAPLPSDDHQARVTFMITGTVNSGDATPESFTVQSGATMRGNDI